MAVKPASTWGANWSSGVTGASQAYQDGVQNTQVDVLGRTLAKQAEMQAGYNAAIASGEWARRRSAVSNAEWKSVTAAKAPNYTTGATAGRPKFDSFAQQAQPIWSQLSNSIDGMASGGKANALARVGAWIDGMTQFKQSYTP